MLTDWETLTQLLWQVGLAVAFLDVTFIVWCLAPLLRQKGTGVDHAG